MMSQYDWCVSLFDKTDNQIYYSSLHSELMKQDNIQLHLMRRRLLLAVDHLPLSINRLNVLVTHRLINTQKCIIEQHLRM